MLISTSDFVSSSKNDTNSSPVIYNIERFAKHEISINVGKRMIMNFKRAEPFNYCNFSHPFLFSSPRCLICLVKRLKLPAPSSTIIIPHHRSTSFVLSKSTTARPCKNLLFTP